MITWRQRIEPLYRRRSAEQQNGAVSAWRRLRLPAATAMLVAGVLFSAASPGVAATTTGSYQVDTERCGPYDHYRCERLPE